MKHILFIFLMLPATVWAQKIQLGLNAGVQYNYKRGELKYENSTGRVNGYVSARALKDFGFLQLGLSVDAGRITEKSNIGAYMDETLTKTTEAVNVIAGVYVAPTLLVNFKVKIAKGYAYAGLAAGYARSFEDKSADGRWVELYTPGHSPHSEYNHFPIGRKFAASSANWLSLGAQVGYTLPLTGKWGLNAEAGLRVMQEDAINNFTVYQAIYFPVSVGVRYNL